MKRIVLICPTMGRPDLHRTLAESWRETKPKQSRLVFVVPDDQRDRYRQVKDCEYIYHPHYGITGMTLPLNLGARLVMCDSDVMCAVGHDVVVRTADWEERVAEASERSLVTYPDDGMNGVNLATAAFLDARVVRAFGFMAPPCLRHLYIDNFWMAAGRALGSLEYLPNVLFEHIHPFAGKRPMDEVTGAVNTPERYAEDRESYRRYLAGEFSADMARVRESLGMKAAQEAVLL